MRGSVVICLVASAFLLACSSRVHGGEHHAGEEPDAAAEPDAMTPDGPATCSGTPCSILDQCGCSGTGMACDVDLSDNAGSACRAVTTPGHETSSCTSLDSCDAGYLCLGDGTGHAACTKYCSADGACGSPRGKCAITVLSGSTPFPDVPKLCSSNCDPNNAAPPECPAADKCTIYTNSGDPFFGCVFAGSGTQGVSCQAGNRGDESLCAAQYGCTTTDGGTTFRCRKYCTDPGTASSNGCGGKACNAFTPAVAVAGVNYGFCSTN